MDTIERREKVAQMSKAIFQYCLSRTNVLFTALCGAPPTIS